MGIAYFIVYGAYSLIVYTIYKSMKKAGASKLIRRVVLAFFILLPTYDIIISNVLKYYYCNFTELEKINRKIDRPEVVFVDNKRYKYEKTPIIVKRYLRYVDIVKINMRDKKNYAFRYDDKKTIIRNQTTKFSRYTQIYKDLELPFFINIFLKGTSNQLIDNKTGEILGWSKSIWKKKYNFIFIDTGYFLNDKSCGEYVYYNLLKKVIKGESNAK